MIKFRSIIFFSILIISSQSMLYLENFTETFSEWQEHSDTIKTVGRSKATLTLQKTEEFQRAILFTLLIPQPCGAGFAGIRKLVNLNLNNYKRIKLQIRGQGQFFGYKFILKQSDSNVSFCHLFRAPKDFGLVEMNLDDFRGYLEGKLVETSQITLDKSRIVSVGLQAYAGKYSTVKQAGVASLEIDWIRFE